MRATDAQARTILGRLPALLLGLWLSGAGCLVCCGRISAAAHEGPAEAASAPTPGAARDQAPAASSAHSCCTARVGSRAKNSPKDSPRGRAAGASRDAGARALSDGAAAAKPAGLGQTGAPRAEGGAGRHVPPRACCERATQVSEQARKPRVSHAPAQAQAAAPLQTPTHAARPLAFVATRARAPDGAATFLRCRALLI